MCFDFREILPEPSLLVVNTLTRVRSSTRFPAVSRLTVHRRREVHDPRRNLPEPAAGPGAWLYSVP
eukprot:8440318-Pyramimonas_sp.AAC.1